MNVLDFDWLTKKKEKYLLVDFVAEGISKNSSVKITEP